MATWADVRRIALDLPETSERVSRELRQWRVKGKGFVWKRPLRGKEIEALGDDASSGPLLAAQVEHLGAKEALLAEDPGVYFTTSHFEGYAAILVRLELIAAEQLDAARIAEANTSGVPFADIHRRALAGELIPAQPPAGG